jgi:tricorn protease
LDGHKLVYRTGGGGGGGRGRGGQGAGAAGPALFLVDADRQPPQPGQGRLNVSLRMYLDSKEEFKQIFNEGWRNQRDYLYVPNMHGADWPKMKEVYGQLLPYVNHRADLSPRTTSVLKARGSGLRRSFTNISIVYSRRKRLRNVSPV